MLPVREILFSQESSMG